MPFLQLTEEVFELQIKHGDNAMGENPLTSASFVTEPMKRVLNYPEVYAAVGRKATLWFSTSREICDELGKRCKNEETPGHHSHAHCLGGASVTRHAGVYTREIAEAICKGYVRMLKRKDPGRIRVMLRSLAGRKRRMRDGEKTTERNHLRWSEKQIKTALE